MTTGEQIDKLKSASTELVRLLTAEERTPEVECALAEVRAILRESLEQTKAGA